MACTERAKWFSSEYNWYAIFVRTLAEQKAVKHVQHLLDTKKYFVFCPTKDYAFKKNGAKQKRKVPWLKGYIFIISTEAEDAVKIALAPIVRIFEDVYKLLTYEKLNKRAMLTERDKAVMTALLDDEFNVAAVKAVVVGDKVQITDDALKGYGGRVVKVNKT